MDHPAHFLYMENSIHIEVYEPVFVPYISQLPGGPSVYIDLIYCQLGCSIDICAVDDFSLCSEFFCNLNE